MPKPIISPDPPQREPADEPRPLPHCLQLDVADPAEEPHALWSMSPGERVAAMWRGQLSLHQLCHWSARKPDEVPLLGGEFAWIAMRTPDWQGDFEPSPEGK
jgi:hypothetical protein